MPHCSSTGYCSSYTSIWLGQVSPVFSYDPRYCKSMAYATIKVTYKTQEGKICISTHDHWQSRTKEQIITEKN